MHWRPLIDSSLVITVVIYAVLCMFAIAGGIFGIVLFWLLALSLWRYCYSVLRSVAQGKSSIPPVSIEDMNFSNEFVLIAHFLMFPALTVAIHQVSPFGTESVGQLLNFVLVILIIFVFPASAAVMGLTSNLVAAVKPSVITPVIRILGRDYFILVGVCSGLGFLSYLIQAVLLSTLGSAWALPVIMLAIWTLLAVFALIGASIHAHRDDFVIPGVLMTQDEREAKDREKGWHATLDLAYASIRSGLVTEGYRTLKQFIAENGDSLELQYWLFENMLEWEDQEPALRIGVHLIEQLMEESLPRAFELYVRCHSLSSDFSIGAETASKLADYAQEIGRFGLASELSAQAEGRSSVRR